MALAFANDSNEDSSCRVFLLDQEGLVAETAVTLEAKSNLPRFLDEIVDFPDVEFFGGVAELECDDPISSIGLLLSGGVFTTIPATVLEQ